MKGNKKVKNISMQYIHMLQITWFGKNFTSTKTDWSVKGGAFWSIPVTHFLHGVTHILPVAFQQYPYSIISSQCLSCECGRIIISVTAMRTYAHMMIVCTLVSTLIYGRPQIGKDGKNYLEILASYILMSSQSSTLLNL